MSRPRSMGLTGSPKSNLLCHSNRANSMSRSPQHEPGQVGWTRSQRRALIALLTVLLVYLTVHFLHNRAYVSDPQPAEGAAGFGAGEPD